MKPREMLGATLLASLLAAGGASAADDPAQTLRRSGIGDPATLDPHLWVDGWEGNIVQDLFVGLTTLDSAVNVVPGAAESWTLSEDGRTYTFLLREGLTWSDGVPLTAQDFVFSFQRIMNPATASPSAALLYDIAGGRAVNTGEADVETLGVRALDKRRVQVRLNEPTPYFPELIVHRGLPAPRHAIEKHGRNWAKPGTLVSNGAFVLDEWIPQVHVRLVKNPRFFTADSVRLQAIYHMPAEDLDTGFRQYRAGEIDILTVIPPNRLDWVRENLPDELHLTPIIGLDYYVFNVNRAPFDDVRVRRALSMAVNREVITQRITKGGEPPAYGLMPPDILNYPDAPEADFKDWDDATRLTRGRKLLAEAGFGPGNSLKFTLRYNTNEQHKRVAVAASSMWKRLGVEVSLVNSEAKVLVADIRAGDFEVARASWFGEVRDAMTYLELLHSGSGPINRSGFSDPDFDRLVDQARRTSDVAERAELMREAEKIALYQQPIMPINFYVSKRLIKPHVGGWVDNARGIHLARYLYVKK